MFYFTPEYANVKFFKMTYDERDQKMAENAIQK